MFGRVSRGLCVAGLALAFSGLAAAQQPEPKKPEAKPAVKVEAKAEAKPQQKENGKDLVEVAKEGKFSTLCELVKLAGLEEVLKGPAPMTLFAPTDDAFKACPDLEELKKPENKAKLVDLLTYHVGKGKLMAADLQKTTEPVKTMQARAVIAVALKDGKVVLNDKVHVVKADMAASNGVLHGIDAVLHAPAEKKVEMKPELKKEEPKREAPKPEPKPEPKPAEKKG